MAFVEGDSVLGGGVPPYLRALVTPMPGCSPEAKYFFTRLLQIYGLSQVFDRGVKELAQRFCVRYGVISRVFSELVELGCLKKNDQGVGRGRPKRFYQCGWPASFAQADMPTIPHASLIEALLSKDYEERGNTQKKGANKGEEGTNTEEDGVPTKRAELGFARRLLLAVLLCHADKNGVVTGLGLADLTRLTGMAREQVKYQISRLERLGCLHPSVAGMTSASLFGVVAGIYFISLRHSCFGGVGRRGLTYACEMDAPYGLFSFAAYIPSDVTGQVGDRDESSAEATDAGSQRAENSDLLHILHGFWVYKASRLYLHAKLNQYASYILTNCWLDLVGGELSSPPPELVGRIQRECFEFSKGKKKQGRNRLIDVEGQALVAKVFAEIALKIAQLILYAVRGSGTAEKAKDSAHLVEGMDHVIVDYRASFKELYFKIDAYYGDQKPAQLPDGGEIAEGGATVSEG